MKQTAVLTQKIELLNLQLKDAEERELNFKKMHETMMAALNGDQPDKNQFSKQLEFANKLHDKEKEEMRKLYYSNKETYDRQICELSEKNIELERRLSESQIKRRDLEHQLDIVEANFRKEKGQMMDEINILSQEREELEILARENQVEVEIRMNDEIARLK